MGGEEGDRWVGFAGFAGLAGLRAMRHCEPGIWMAGGAVMGASSVVAIADAYYPS